MRIVIPVLFFAYCLCGADSLLPDANQFAKITGHEEEMYKLQEPEESLPPLIGQAEYRFEKARGARGGASYWYYVKIYKPGEHPMGKFFKALQSKEDRTEEEQILLDGFARFQMELPDGRIIQTWGGGGSGGSFGQYWITTKDRRFDLEIKRAINHEEEIFIRQPRKTIGQVLLDLEEFVMAKNKVKNANKSEVSIPLAPASLTP